MREINEAFGELNSLCSFYLHGTLPTPAPAAPAAGTATSASSSSSGPSASAPSAAAAWTPTPGVRSGAGAGAAKAGKEGAGLGPEAAGSTSSGVPGVGNCSGTPNLQCPQTKLAILQQASQLISLLEREIKGTFVRCIAHHIASQFVPSYVFLFRVTGGDGDGYGVGDGTRHDTTLYTQTRLALMLRSSPLRSERNRVVSSQ